jgi:transcriptional regulator with XRE-family HTH domain
MDMQIDSDRIRTEREKRAWSQEHLAEVAGLALRTIQRVENSGAASYESARAIAAVLELEVSALMIPVTANRATWSQPVRYASAAALLLLALGVFFARDARAGQVKLDVELTLNNQKLSQHHLTVEEGKGAEIRLEGQVRMVVTPTIAADGNILLSIRLQEFSGSELVAVGNPQLLAYDDRAAAVSVTSAKGNVFRIEIKPHKV